MDKLILDIKKLQDTVAQSGKALADTREQNAAVKNTNKNLTATGTWQGDGANSYKGKADEIGRNLAKHGDAVNKMKNAMKTVLTRAEALDRQARGFAGIAGGSSGGGAANTLTFDPDAKASAISACGRAIGEIETQLAQTGRAESAMSGVSGFRVSSDLSSFRRTLNDRKNKLSRLRDAITKYAASAEEFVAMAVRLFGGIDLPEDAIATLESWGMTQDQIIAMLMGLNMGCCEYGGDPVNMATGNFIYEKEYLKIKGLYPLSFRMFYNALEKRSGPLGPGWSHNYGVSLHKSGEAVTIRLEDGREETFYRNDGGTYKQNFNKHDALRKTNKGYMYKNADNLNYTFDEDGRHIRLADPNGNGVALAYEQGLLVCVENNCGGALAYEYSGGGLITQVSDHTGRMVRLEYEDGKLTTVTGEEGQEQKYEYSANGRISSITNPLGVTVLANEYDAENRVRKQAFPDGGLIQYDYRDEERELRVTEQNGNEVTYTHDERMRSTGAIYTDGETRYAYNEQNQRTWQIDKNGNETRYAYDSRGNISQVTDALGETVSAEYNALNKPTRITLCGIEQMKAVYDSKGNLLSMSDALGRARTIEYNRNGRPTRLSQPDGSEVLLAYDERGNIVCVTESASVTKYEYDGSNRIIATTDPNGNRTSFSYDRRDEIVKVVNAEGKERAYEYNQAGKLTKITDFDGGGSLYEYNALSKPVRYVDPSGHATLLEYDLMWNVTRQTDANGAETRLEYDALQRLVKVTNALGHSVEYGYDPNGNRTSITDPQGGQIKLEYDALNRVTDVTEADGASSSATYNEMGQVTSITDAMGNRRTFVYDAAGQKTEETDLMGNMTVFTYTQLGKVSSVTDPAGRVTRYEYAPGGLLTREAYPDGRWVDYEYDAAKNLITRIDQSGYALNYAYDSLNRIVKIISNHGQVKRFSYDALGNVASMTDANGNTTRYSYSTAGKLIQVIDALCNKSEYGYDSMGELIQVRQLSGVDEELSGACSVNEGNSQMRMTTYHRDMLGRVENVEDALGQREVYAYDAFDRVTGKTDKDGYHTQFVYGQNGELEHIQYADGKSVRLSYNPLRHLTQIQNWLGQTTIETDPMGRAIKVKDHNGKEVQYLYGAGGERLEIIYPDGKKAAYQYDEALRLSRLTDGESIVTYSYDENSRLSGIQFPNGMFSRYEYNDMGLLSSLTHNDRAGVLDHITYKYDPMGNKIGIDKFRRGLEVDSGQFGYVYDALGRLSDVSKDGELLRTYEYDAFGNRSRATEGGKQTSYSYNALNQLVRAEMPGITLDYRYDARGNMTSVKENESVKHLYEFGVLNRLEKATNADGLSSLYEYNGLGQRMSSQITGSLKPTINISYILDLTRQYHNLLQTDEDGRTKNYLCDFKVVAESGIEGDRFYLQDELGSPLRFTGADGTLIDSYAYDEFGNDLTGNQGAMQPFGYTGYRYDNLAGTYFAQTREYQPKTGRFLTEDTHWSPSNMIYGDNPVKWNERCSNPNDPLGMNAYIYRPDIHAIMQSGNLYAYCGNNPIAYTDSNGRFWHLVIGALAGAVVGTAVSVVVQLTTTGEVSFSTTIIAAGSGALSGALAMSGAGIVVQVLANGAIGAVAGAGNSYFETGAVDPWAVAIGLTAGLIGGALGGAGANCNTYLGSLSDNLMKRVGHALSNKTGSALLKEIRKAVVYYIKSSGTTVTGGLEGILRSTIPSAAIGGATALSNLITRIMNDLNGRTAGGGGWIPENANR